MPSSRQALAVFLATAAVVAVIVVVVFVFPGFPVTRCSPNVEPSTSPGHWFCSETFTLPRVPPDCGSGIAMVNGTPVARELSGVSFQAHLFKYCIEPANLGFNASVVQPNGRAYNVTDFGGIGILEDWFNWTSPDNQSGLQWRGNSTLAFLAAG